MTLWREGDSTRSGRFSAPNNIHAFALRLRRRRDSEACSDMSSEARRARRSFLGCCSSLRDLTAQLTRKGCSNSLSTSSSVELGSLLPDRPPEARSRSAQLAPRPNLRSMPKSQLRAITYGTAAHSSNSIDAKLSATGSLSTRPPAATISPHTMSRRLRKTCARSMAT